MIGWRLLASLASQLGTSVVLEAARLGDPDYAVAAVVGGIDLCERLRGRVMFAPDGALPSNALGWPDRARAWIGCPPLEALPCEGLESCVTALANADEVERLAVQIRRRYAGLGWKASFAARFVDFVGTSAIEHADQHVAYAAVRRLSNGVWVAVGDTGPGIPKTSPVIAVGPSTLAYWTQRLDARGERGLGELAGLWRACSVIGAEADFASGDELRQLTRSGGTTDTFFGGSGPTVLSARV